MSLHDLLLHLYPRAFRSEYGEEMRAVFAERRRRSSGVLGSTLLYLEAIPDLVVNAALVQGDFLRQDLRHALRGFAREPGFAATAVLVVALGIGATTAVFSVADRVLIRPLPFPDSERLVKLWERVPQYSRMELSPLNYLDWKRMSSSFEILAAYHDQSMILTGEGEPVVLEGIAASSELFSLLGIPALFGRTLSEEDGAAGAPNVIVLSYRLWQRLLGGRRDVLGKSLRLDGLGYTVVGVMPRDFLFPSPEDGFWVAMRFDGGDLEDRDNNYLSAIAKLEEGVSIERARSGLDIVTEELERRFPEENESTRATVLFLRDDVPPQSRWLLAALAGASGCLLLIACSNLASLLLARASARAKELTLRGALGAGRERLVRHLLTESLALALLGGFLGLLIAAAAVPLLARLVPTYVPLSEPTAIDPRVLAFTTLLTLASGLFFGALPALETGRHLDPARLKEGARSGIGGRRQRLRAAIVVLQLSATLVLLVGSGLLIRAFLSVRAIDPGFRTEDILAVHVPLPRPRYEPTARRAELYSRVVSEVRSLPGVEGAAFVSFLPMVMRGGVWPVEIEGLPETGGDSDRASLRFVTPGFFSTLGISLRSGRDFRESDDEEAPDVAVVSESFARRYWPSEDPLGRRFEMAFRERRVIGVVSDIRVRGLERESEPQVYLPHRQVSDGGLIFYAPKELVLRSPDVEQQVGAVRRILRAADPELPVAEVRRLEEVVDAETAPRSAQLRVLGIFTAFSVLLAGVGLYGLLAFGVAQKRSEIGLRMALGARTSDIFLRTLREGAVLAAIGSALGLALAYAAARSMSALLAGVEPSDGATYLSSCVVVLIVTAFGSVVPALRAVAIDPTRTLREE